LHRPSAATVISLVALFFAMSGTAVAATGGNLILGKANTATSVSSLTNTKGTALKLSSTLTTPPLTVSNSVQVPNLNASELGGQPASGFVQGGGTVSDGRLSLSFPGDPTGTLISAPGSSIQAFCNAGLNNPLFLSATQNEVVTWFNGSSVQQASLTGGDQQLEGPTGVPTMIWVQVDTGSGISTYTLTESFNGGTNACNLTGQVVTTNG
jgi:hypothetical protein